MNWFRNTLLYTLLLFAASVAVGFVLGLIGRVVGLEHEWGVLDVGAVIRVITVFIVALGVFAALASKRPREYYSIGAGVVVLTSILSTASAYALAPAASREGYNWVGLVVWPLIVNVIALVVGGLVLRLRRSSSNTSLERTRDR